MPLLGKSAEANYADDFEHHWKGLHEAYKRQRAIIDGQRREIERLQRANTQLEDRNQQEVRARADAEARLNAELAAYRRKQPDRRTDRDEQYRKLAEDYRRLYDQEIRTLAYHYPLPADASLRDRCEVRHLVVSALLGPDEPTTPALSRLLAETQSCGAGLGSDLTAAIEDAIEAAVTLRRGLRRLGSAFRWDDKYEPGVPFDAARQQLFQGCPDDGLVEFIVAPGFVIVGDPEPYVRQVVFTSPGIPHDETPRRLPLIGSDQVSPKGATG